MNTKENNKHIAVSRLIRWVGTGFSTALFIYLLSWMDWQQTIASLHQLPWWLLLVVFICYILGMVANGFRWHILLMAQRVKVTFLEVMKMIFTGAFISNFLPSTVGGDIARIAASYKYTKSASLSAASVLLERIINMASMISAAPFVISLARPGSGFQDFFFPKQLSSFFSISSFFKKQIVWIEKRWSNEIATIKLAAKIWLKQPLTLVWAFVVAWGSNLVVFLGMWLLANRIGMQISFLQVIGVNFLVYFVTLLPISINGFGVKELSEISIYMFLGATLEQATIFTILSRFFALAETFPGVLWVSEAFNFSKNNQNSADVKISSDL